MKLYKNFIMLVTLLSLSVIFISCEKEQIGDTNDSGVEITEKLSAKATRSGWVRIRSRDMVQCSAGWTWIPDNARRVALRSNNNQVTLGTIDCRGLNRVCRNGGGTMFCMD